MLDFQVSRRITGRRFTAQFAEAVLKQRPQEFLSKSAECLLNLLRFADEIPSAEYVLVDDGSLEDVGEVKVFLKHMKDSFGVRVKFHRQHLGVGSICHLSIMLPLSLSYCPCLCLLNTVASHYFTVGLSGCGMS
jgi:hypothetical protein